MRRKQKNNFCTRGKRICITAFFLTGSLMLGGCGGKKEDAADSGLPEIVIGMDYFEPYSYQASPLRKADIRNPLCYLLMNAVASRPVSGSFQLPLT